MLAGSGKEHAVNNIRQKVQDFFLLIHVIDERQTPAAASFQSSQKLSILQSLSVNDISYLKKNKTREKKENNNNNKNKTKMVACFTEKTSFLYLYQA